MKYRNSIKRFLSLFLVVCLFSQCFILKSFAAQNKSYEVLQDVDCKSKDLIQLKMKDGANFVVPAGLYFVPGVGEVFVAAAGAIIVAGVTIEVGSWIYNKVVSWFESEEQKESDYDDAKQDGTPTKNHDSGSTDNPGMKGNPRSSRDKKDSDGNVIQRRYFDKNGNPDMDIDYAHGGSGHTFPHRHYWNGTERGPAVPF